MSEQRVPDGAVVILIENEFGYSQLQMKECESATEVLALCCKAMLGLGYFKSSIDSVLEEVSCMDELEN